MHCDIELTVLTHIGVYSLFVIIGGAQQCGWTRLLELLRWPRMAPGV